jgi:DNA modification methylase
MLDRHSCSQSCAILTGDCRETLATLEPGSVQTCVTSPPYFGLRDYGHDGQIGNERNLLEYVVALRDVFRAVRRVLRDDGTLWLNLGDSYDSRKSLIGVPWKVAERLKQDGWILRSDIIWAKPNPMPESVTDRPTKAHEYLFLLSKSARYFYDADAIREDQSPESVARRGRGDWRGKEGWAEAYHGNPPRGLARQSERPVDRGANKRSVWTVATQPFPGAHFATFPPKLIEPCILAGSPERACGVCGAPWERIVENHGPDKVNEHDRHTPGIPGRSDNGRQQGLSGVAMGARWHRETLGFAPACDHGVPAMSGVVLDPFAGAGTTGMVALRHNRSFVGCEQNPEYVALARDRIIADSPLLNTHAEVA